MIKNWLIIKHKEFYQVGSVFFVGLVFFSRDGSSFFKAAGSGSYFYTNPYPQQKKPGRENEAGEGRSGQAPRPATDEKQGRQPTYQKNIINNQ